MFIKEETQGLYLQLKIKMGWCTLAQHQAEVPAEVPKRIYLCQPSNTQCFRWQILLLSETHTLSWHNFQLIPKLTRLTPDQGPWALCSVAIKILWRGIMVVWTSKGAKKFQEKKSAVKVFHWHEKNESMITLNKFGS